MRWVKLADIRNTRSYRSNNALRLYCHIVLTCGDGSPLRLSLNDASRVIASTRDAARYALKLLSEEGLITRAGEIVRAVPPSDLGAMIIDPMPALRKNWARIVVALGGDNQDLGNRAVEFARRNIVAHKRWQSEDDVISHFMAWHDQHKPRDGGERAKKAAIKAEREKQYQEEQRKQAEQREREWQERSKEKVSYEEYKAMKARGEIT